MTMTKEEEFYMNKLTFEEQKLMNEKYETPIFKSAVQDHPDFAFLDENTLENYEKTIIPSWMKEFLSIEKNLKQWIIFEIQIRPDIKWENVKDLIVTVCIGRGLVIEEETKSSVTLRKQLAPSSTLNQTRYQNVFARVGVTPSKLRVIDICCSFTEENSLLRAVVPVGKLTTSKSEELIQEADELAAAVQSAIISWNLSLSSLYMSSEDNLCSPEEDIKLDEGYIEDVKRMFRSEMKDTMKDLCIPLEQFAYVREYNCALLISLIDPFLKKYNIVLPDSSSMVSDPKTIMMESEEWPIPSSTNESEKKSDQHLETLAIASDNKRIRGQVINELVQKLWNDAKLECDKKINQKAQEKRLHIISRLRAVKRLRREAIYSIINHEGAETEYAPLKQGQQVHQRNNVLLYEGSCVVNAIPSRLNVTFGSLIYRTLVPLFSTTTELSFASIISVSKCTHFGIRSIQLDVSVEEDIVQKYFITMGVDQDLLYELLYEIYLMHHGDDDSLQQTGITTSYSGLGLSDGEEESKQDEEESKVMSFDAFTSTSAANVRRNDEEVSEVDALIALHEHEEEQSKH